MQARGARLSLQPQVLVGDVLASVNGLQGSPQFFFDRIRTLTDMDLTFVRRAHGEGSDETSAAEC